MSDISIKSQSFHVDSLHCADEFALIETGLRSLNGIEQMAPDYVNRTLRVEYDADALDAAAIADHLRRIGFPAQSVGDKPGERRRATDPSHLRGTTLGGGVLLLAAIAWYWIAQLLQTGDLYLVAVLAIVSTALTGWPVALAALRAVRLRRLDMNALMTIAAVGAIFTAQWLEAATAMFLFGISLWLESYSMRRASRAVRTLVELSPTVAHRIDESHDADWQNESVSRVTDVSPDDIRVGELVLVKPGERVSVDGVVVHGSSAVNQAPITGESTPIEKSPGEKVYAGSLNGEGALKIRTERPAHDSTLAHVARLVEQAQSNRSPTERFVDSFARRYTPAVIGMAICIVFGPPLLAWAGVEWAAQETFTEWFHRGLVMLVIACPCALVISTPITIVCGLHQATRYGMLVKGGEFLETAGRIDCLAIDKTGTLTTGNHKVIRVASLDGQTEGDVLRIAAALETGSEHPLAAAIVAAARERHLTWQAVSDSVALRGFGVQGTVNGKTYFVASPRFFQEELQEGVAIPDGLATGDGASTVALVGSRDSLLGAIYLADEPRDDAKESLSELKRLGVKNMVMLTGDNGATALRIAHSLGLTQVHAELLPEDKVTVVRNLARQYAHLAMVGDGVNDAPALAASRLGIALGSQSSDTALETADVVVMSPRLARLPQLVRLGRRTRFVLWQNILIALTLKTAVLLLAAFGLATMWMAVAADVGASMIVILNGMRLLSHWRNGNDAQIPPGEENKHHTGDAELSQQEAAAARY